MSNTIPQGWSFEKVGKLILEFSQKCSVENEHEVLTSSKSGLMRQSDYYGENRITRRSTIDFNVIPQNYITYRSRSDNNRFTFNQNTLGFKGLISKYYPVFTHSEGEVYNNFLLNLFNFYSGVFALESVGTSQLVLSINAVKSVRLPFPPLPEQQKIATILSSVDDVIEKTRAQIDKLKDLKTGMMQELLTKGIGHTEFKDSPVGRIPVCWQTVRLEDVLDRIDSGWSPSCIEVPPAPSEWGVLKVSSVTRGEFLELESKTLPKSLLPREQAQIHKGDILLTRANGVAELVGKCVIVRSEPLAKLMMSDKILRLRPNTKLDNEFLLHAFNSQTTRNQIKLSWGGSSGQKNISQSDIKTYLVPLPPFEEQQLIAQSITQVEQVVFDKSKKLSALCAAKKALMQDLLTGKVRVNITDKESAVV